MDSWRPRNEASCEMITEGGYKITKSHMQNIVALMVLQSFSYVITPYVHAQQGLSNWLCLPVGFNVS